MSEYQRRIVELLQFTNVAIGGSNVFAPFDDVLRKVCKGNKDDFMLLASMYYALPATSTPVSTVALPTPVKSTPASNRRHTNSKHSRTAHKQAKADDNSDSANDSNNDGTDDEAPVSSTEEQPASKNVTCTSCNKSFSNSTIQKYVTTKYLPLVTQLIR